ncbi:hypothetical protein MHH28_24985 [Paenibacillus sp. FSL K6-1217]|uniref:hypothetical protein n=1 Tax=Paenibacillus sp. FSL K6-1217 TaxID=2921466 RepID=UPI00324571EB
MAWGFVRRVSCEGILHEMQHCGSIGAAWAEMLHEMQHCGSAGAACAEILHEMQHCGSIGAVCAEILHEMQQSSSGQRRIAGIPAKVATMCHKQ